MEAGDLPANYDRLGFHLDRPLYKHQVDALFQISSGRNAVVSTGTGSGKTESFLFPITKHLVEEANAGTLGRGVRAMLIYPMNALANDQVERLRELLADFPEITFGCYTGQTAEKYDAALANYKQLNNGSLPLKNELKAVFEASLTQMLGCTCGGESMDTSCYSCLRNYYNQKYHDLLQRGYVVRFLKSVLTKNS